MAERGNGEIKRTFDRLGGRAEKKTDLGYMLRAKRQADGLPAVNAEPGGHPDYHWMLPPMGGYIEAKEASSRDGVYNFQFSQFDSKQRDWMNALPMICWLWLWYGEVPPDRVKDPARRRAYLLPWLEWLRLEHLLQEAGLSGLAFLQAHELQHRTAGLQAVNLLADYELAWVGKGAWDVPAPHVFWRQPVTLVSLFAPACLRASTPEATYAISA